MGKCVNCGKKSLFLNKEYCHACGKQICSDCMIRLFRFLSSFLRKDVIVCSIDCWWDLADHIEDIIHRNMSEAWNAEEKVPEYDGDEGRHVNEVLIPAYLSYAQENPNYPYKNRIERGFKKKREASELYARVDIIWFYDLGKMESWKKHPYEYVFPQYQDRRNKKPGKYRQYKGVRYKNQVDVFEDRPLFKQELPADSSVGFFRRLMASRLRKQEEMGGPSFKAAFRLMDRNFLETRSREKREIEKERLEEYMKNRSWDLALAEDRGTCDWCNEELKWRDGVGSYWPCPHGEGFFGSCCKIFCSPRCLHAHLHNIHNE